MTGYHNVISSELTGLAELTKLYPGTRVAVLQATQVLVAMIFSQRTVSPNLFIATICHRPSQDIVTISKPQLQALHNVQLGQSQLLFDFVCLRLHWRNNNAI